jgi:transglutaminase-like putative cysteine protease
MSNNGRGSAPDRTSASATSYAPRSETPYRPWAETAASATLGRRSIPFAPEEGWLTVVLVVLLVMPIAWSIDDARWVLGDSQWTRFLPWTVIGGAAWGMYGAKVGWGRWTTHLLGAVVAAIVVPILVGSVLPLTAGTGSPGVWFHATADAAVEAVLDFTVRNRTVTSQLGHHLLILGLICWATAQFAGFAVLGHRRPLGAVFVTGLVLLLNIAITIRDQLPFLVIFTCAALLLLVRVHADDEKASWLQRRIGDPSTVTGLYLRGGTAFVTIAVLGSLFLTSTAASAPLAGAFSGFSDKLVSIGQEIQRFFPVGGPGTKITGVSFGPAVTIQSKWETNQVEALTIQVPPGDTTPYYWKAAAYNTFDGRTWLYSSDNVKFDNPVGSTILEGTGDQVPSPELRNKLTFKVTKVDFNGRTVFAPDAVNTIDMSTSLTVVGSDGYFAGLEANDSFTSYTATALVPRIGNDGFTANKLRAASADYSAEIRATYLRPIGPEILGPFSMKLIDEIKGTALSDCLARSTRQKDPAAFCATNAYDPYDLAEAAKAVLRSSEFRYETDISGLECDNVSKVECFAHFKQGFCQQYATTMAVVLRSLGVATRYVQGWLPSTPDSAGIEKILLSNSHAWVEVYFPGYGWYVFDPTGNGTTQPLPLIPGLPVPSASPAASSSPRASGRDVFEPPDRTTRPAGGGVVTAPPASSNGPFIVVALILIFAVGLLAFVAYQRGPRGPTQAETAWSALVRLAGRFGWAPRPTQTPFEFAGALGDVLPIARADLQTVAAAKVEVAYGRKTLDPDRLSVLRVAQRKLRVTLLRLAFRRPKRKGRVRRI